MAYINKGDLLKINGQLAVATSNNYTKMIYDAYDLELGANGFEGGTAVGYVNVMYSNAPITTSIPLDEVTKISS